MNSPQLTNVRTRFAPSPTGYLHVGGARTALFNYLFARKHGGTFILRIEDTDQARNTEAARAAIFEGMQWLGMQWDEGPDVGGDCGPYNQSERQAIYDSYFKKLEESGRAYPDDGAYRFRFERKLMVIQDLVCGEVKVDYADESINPDMVIKRSDGSYTFHFVNVVDDIEMQMSHVIRGEDHLMNTPKHLQLFEAFGVTPPAYAHIPLILNMDGSKMSKRDQGAAISEYPKLGYTSEAVFNFLALLGWSPKDDNELFSPDELIEKFTIESVNRAPGKFDIEKCRWVNQQHLAKLSPEAFAEAATPVAKLAGFPIDEQFPAMAASIQEKVRLLSEVPAQIAFFYDHDYPFDSEAITKVQKNAQAAELLSLLAAALEKLDQWSEAKATIGATAKANGAKPGQLMFPTRVALTGAAGGPDLGAILDILGQTESVRRIQRAVVELSQ